MTRVGAPSTKDGGYLLVQMPGHPLAYTRGSVYAHRLILYARIGPGTHPCHWCHRPVTWRARGARALTADHVDHNPANNHPTNLVPSCRPCNSSRIGVRPPTTAPIPAPTPGQASRRW